MARNVFLATIIVFLIVADVSDAAFFFYNRKLVAPAPKEDPKISPIPSPVSTDGKKSSSVGGEEKGKEKKNEPAPDSNKPKGKVDQGETPPSDAKEGIKNPNGEVKDNKEVNKPETPPTDTKNDKGESKPDLPHGVKQNCNGDSQKCQDKKFMIACVESYNNVSKELILLIQNEGDSGINVDLMIPPSLDKTRLVNVSKHQTEMVNIPLPNGISNEVRLNAGNGDCILNQGPPVSQGNIFRLLPSYSKFITPIYGAYLLFLVVIISGGVWGCCWFKKRKSKTLSEIPYQELEMSVPETADVVVESAEGWDQVWDDDWDEEKAVKSPGARNTSANEPTLKTPSKDDWEDWDD